MTIPCPYCGKPAALVGGEAIYPHRPDLHAKKFWRCAPCDAHVGCHPGTTKPLGRLADPELRAAKVRAHAAFDPLWRRKMEVERISQGAARSKAYRWLAEELGMKPEVCHIGMFDVAGCNRVVRICAPFTTNRRPKERL